MTLFATHYHELIFLADKLSSAFNLNIEVKEYNDEIIFLRKIISGGASKSYGIQVAEMAGLPKQVVLRAKELLSEFINKDSKVNKTRNFKFAKEQMNLFNYNNKGIELLSSLIDIDIVDNVMF